MDAVILCAGRGERMRPFTDTLPKSLAPVCGRPLLDYHIEGLLAANAHRIILVVNYLREHIVEHVSRYSLEVEATLVWQEAPLGITDAFMRVRQRVKSNFLAIHSDNLFVPNVFSLLAERHVPGAVTMATVPYEGKSPRNRARQSPVTGRLRLASNASSPKDDVDVQTTGCCILPAQIFDLLERGRAENPSCDVYDVLCANQGALNMVGVLHEGLWANINTQEDIRQLEARLPPA